MSLPFERSTIKGSTLVCSSLASKYQTRVLVTNIDKHSSLLPYGNNYGRKNFQRKGPRALYYKTFYGRNLHIFVISLSVCSGKPFQSSLMFGSEARSLPQSGAPGRCLIWVGSILTHKHQIGLKRFARDKHSSLLRKSINYSRKMFYSTGPWSEEVKSENQNDLKMLESLKPLA